MSVVDTQIIDMWGIPKDDPTKIVLAVSDHMDWKKTEQGDHLLMLQAKLNTYIAFIESGEIFTNIPTAQGKSPVIRVMGKYPLSLEAETFIGRAASVLRGEGIELEFVLDAS
ncbi:DUF6572 domain-containing protein [Pseudomonas sp. NPDC096950]|uniref:DUF6572 domain-containing protein n=1 Tax=Pseudomonas sp. NPDC096950 TaxID=3364485 RepID=UPI00383A20B5